MLLNQEGSPQDCRKIRNKQKRPDKKKPQKAALFRFFISEKNTDTAPKESIEENK